MCVLVYVYILHVRESLLCTITSKKTMGFRRRRVGSKFKISFFSPLGQRKGITLKAADGGSWRGSRWTNTRHQKMEVSGVTWVLAWELQSIPGGSQKEYVGETHSFFIPKWPSVLHSANEFLFVGVSLNLLPNLQAVMCMNSGLQMRESLFPAWGKKDKNCFPIISYLFLLLCCWRGWVRQETPLRMNN